MTTMQRPASTCEHEAKHLAAAIVTGQRPVRAQVGGLKHSTGMATYRPPLLMPRADEAWTGALVAIAPHLDSAEWPLGNSPDEEKVTAVVEQFAQKGDRDPQEVFDELLSDAQRIANRTVYKRLVVALSHALERNGRLDQHGIAKVCGVVTKTFEDEEEQKDMQHKVFPTIESEVSAPGSFVALVATWQPDRVGDVIRFGAFRKSLERWAESGQMLPVLADHHGKVASVVGRVDPRLSTETERGLEVAGVLDRKTDTSRRVLAGR